MIIPEEIQCRSCLYLSSHPVDACPVCGAQFYWLIVPTHQIGDGPIREYLSAMERLVEGRITREFLTHGGQLWLPHSFWNYNPNGDLLKEFSWISEIKFYQHDPEKEEEKSAPSNYREKGPRTIWDTNPLPVIPTLAQAGAGGTESQAERPSRPRGSVPAKEAPPPPAPAFARELLAPLMILIFFIFLSLSYLVLRYHKNQPRVSSSISATEVPPNEREVLP